MSDAITMTATRNGELIFEVILDDVPKHAILRECYETDTEIVVVGWPRADDHLHNCDQMGCTSVSHVMHRFKKEIEAGVIAKLAPGRTVVDGAGDEGGDCLILSEVADA